MLLSETLSKVGALGQQRSQLFLPTPSTLLSALTLNEVPTSLPPLVHLPTEDAVGSRFFNYQVIISTFAK